MRLVATLLLLLTLLSAGAQTPAAIRPVSATIDAAKTGSPISPYVYGQFLEHIGSLIYSSLWSEMLDDRKFYYAVAPKPAGDPEPAQRPSAGFGGGRRRGIGPGRWNPIGPADAVAMDTNEPYVGDHTPLIRLAGSAPRGIRQTGLNFIKDATYNGRLRMAGDAAAKVSVSIVWGTGAARQTVKLGKPGKNYKNYTFSFKAAGSGSAQFEISATGTGSLRIGAVSLMPADNLEGFRPEAVAALRSLRSGVYRFPGGNFVSAHEWRDAIGDPDKRPSVFDPVWNAVQPNDIGTDEFMTLCKLLGVEPYITVNAGFGDAWSAAQYVEYANGSVKTPMGKLRAANGHPAPYRVKFWGIGNEAWGDWQYGAMSLKQFEAKHNQFAKAMRKADPTIVLIASGAMPDTMTGSRQSLRFGTNLVPAYLSPGDWTGGLLSNCFNSFDLISEHYYNYGNTHFSLAEGRQVPNDPNEPITDWMRRPANHVRIKYEEYKEYEKVLPQLVVHPKPLNIDEWAYTGDHHPTYPAYAWVFQEMFRHSDVIQMAAFTFATSLLARDGTNVSLNANGLVFKLYRDHFGSIPVTVAGNSPQPKPTAPPGGEQPVVNAGSDTFPLDVAAAWTADRRTLTVAVLNPTDTEQNLRLDLRSASVCGKGTLWRLASTDNDAQHPNISHSQVDSVPDSLTCPPFSISIYELPAIATTASGGPGVSPGRAGHLPYAAAGVATLKDTFKDCFMVGVALNQRQFTEEDTNGAALVKAQFNAISPENVMKWERIHPRPGPEGYDFKAADRYVEFGEKNGMFIVGHTLVWHGQTPRWVFQGEGTNAITPDELLQRMRDHIHTVVGRYKGRIKAWDVVNEALNEDGSLRNSPWRRIIGDDYIAKAFEYAHEADPAAELRYNDYAIENEPKRQGVIALVKKLKAENVPIHGLGSQTHANLTWPSADLLDSALTAFAELGIPISITELDVNASQRGQRSQSADVSQNAQTGNGGLADAAQQRLADQYASLFRVFLKHRKDIQLVTFWGVTDRDSWRRCGNPLLFDGEWRPKPAFGAVIEEAKKAAHGRWSLCLRAGA